MRRSQRWVLGSLVFLAALVFYTISVLYAQPGPILRVTPAPGAEQVWLGTTIYIEFSEAMDHANVLARFQMDPPVAGDFLWSPSGTGESLTFEPHDILQPGTRYQLTLQAGLQNANGEIVLTEDYRWSFTTRAAQPAISFGYGSPIQLVDPDGQNAVVFWSGYPRIMVDFALYAVEPAEFARRYAGLEPFQDIPIDVTGLPRVAQWSQTFHHEQSRLSSAIIPSTVSSGIYVLTASHPAAGQDEMYIVLSRHVLALKQGGDGQVVAWATRLQAQEATPEMAITLYDAAGQALTTGTTDAEGLARLSATRARLAVGTRDGEVTVAGLDGAWRSDGPYWWWESNSTVLPQYQVYLYTDRPIYRPGHLVQYAGIVRHDQDGLYTPIASSTVLTATLRDSRNNVVGTQAVAADEFGTVHGAFKLGEEPPLGTYTLDLDVAGEVHSHTFQVEAYRKPEYQVQVRTGAEYAIAGDEIAVAVDADYFFGQPVAHSEVVLKVYRRYTYAYWWGSSMGEQVAELRGETDAAGRWQTVFTTDVTLGQDAVYTFQAQVTDASRQPVEGGLSLPVYWNTYRMNLTTEKYGYQVREPIAVHIALQDHAALPVASKSVTVLLTRHYPREETVMRRFAITNAAGLATVTLTDVPAGWYELAAVTRDTRGRTVRVSRWVWVFDPAQTGWWYSDADELTINADKETYAPGDTAKLLIQSKVAGVALLTLERGTVRAEQIVSLEEGMTSVEVPVREDYAPNLFATIQVFKPLDEEDAQQYYWNNRPEGRMLIAQTELVVPVEGRELTVDIMADARQYEPRQPAVLTLRVTDATGQPVRARVTLALVDEAIFALAEDLSADMVATFYGRRSNQVLTFDSLRPNRYVGGPQLDEGAPAPAPGATPTASPTQTPSLGRAEEGQSEGPRREFPDTAYWNPVIETDAAGEAVVVVDLPDNLTTWRVIARAVTLDTLVGEGTSQILVTKAVIARPALPRFAVVGDEFALDAIGQNFAGQMLEASMSINAPALTILDPGSRTLMLENGVSGVARWSAVASQVGPGLVTCELQTPAGNDAVELPLPVHPFAVPQRQALAGLADPVAEVTFEVPFNAVQPASAVEVRLASSIALGLLDGLEYLIDYPYGCVEQTMSRVLPTAVAARAYQGLGIPNPKADELPEIIAQGLQRLYGFQHEDGSWGWWYDDDGGVYLTAYVLLGLVEVENAGFDVADEVLERGFAFLTVRREAVEDPRIDAFALYVMSLAGRGDLAAAQVLVGLQDRLDHFARAALALTLQMEGDAEAAQELVRRLASDAVETPTTAHWPETSYTEYQPYHWRTMASAEKATAMAVLALTRLEPDSQLLPKAVRWLMNHRQGHRWRDTQATAFAVLGLTDYILVAGELEAQYDYVVWLNGERIAAGRVDPSTATVPIDPILIAGDRLQVGENTLRIERAGTGMLYYTLLQRLALFYDGFEPVQSVDQGLRIQRRYQLQQDTPMAGRDPGTGQRDLRFQVGDLVEVSLTVEATDEVWYVLVEDPLPAGFEALQQGLNPVSYGDHFGFPIWREWGYNRKNVYDDRVTFFITRLWPGRHEFRYLMRAVTPGAFSVLPAQVYPMYLEEMWGRSSSLQVSVSPEALVPRPKLAGDIDRDCQVTRWDVQQMAGVWGSRLPARDLDGDGTIGLWDVAAVASRQGASCLATQDLPVAGEGQVKLIVMPEKSQTMVGEPFRVAVRVEQIDLSGGGFSLQLRYDPLDLQVLDVVMASVGSDGWILGPRVDHSAGTVALGALGLRDGQAGRQVAVVRFMPQRQGEVRLAVDQVEAVDAAGRRLLAGAVVQGATTVVPQRVRLPLLLR